MRRRRIGCTGRGRNVAISNVNVAATVTVIAAADAYRSSISIQHVDTTDGTIAVWVGNSPTLAVGEGFYLSGVGVLFSAGREEDAPQPWYGIAASGTVTVAVSAGG